MAQKRVKKTTKKVAEKVSAVKKVINAIKAWLSANGVEGILGVIAGVILWIFGYKIYAGFAFGVFATRNWDFIKGWVLKLLNK
ncbi:MAG: hypothetical protein CL662_00690 [Bacteroidetes bacterium]|nr:hypothetical protein [Bacteroidota bacterium]|tara:strand:- start:280 stop:528 length:249 start_codon:yes stop_codon:yes gene_type:complete